MREPRKKLDAIDYGYIVVATIGVIVTSMGIRELFRRYFAGEL